MTPKSGKPVFGQTDVNSGNQFNRSRDIGFPNTLFRWERRAHSRPSMTLCVTAF
jgi:hypothetical protein